jgi:GNAT superfamily N-acetyltransferase
VTIRVRGYAAGDTAACLALFDRNCPTWFAPNERPDFADYLAASGSDYRLCERGGATVAAFGVTTRSGRARLNWIMVDPAAHGHGIGAAIMAEAAALARRAGASAIDIAASHLSAPFFAHFGAQQTERIDHGWGPDMHRVDMVLEL